MSGRAVERIETVADTLAAAVFAAATGYAVGSLLHGIVGHAQLEVAAATAFVTSYLLCIRGLRTIAATAPRLSLPEFAVPALESVPFDELVLTDADRLRPGDDEPLELDDILAEIGPDSRVVRLFDPSAMPTPGQLRARIDRHLDEGSAAAPDASEALFEALAELRRSLA
jgi:hypothetical protein